MTYEELIDFIQNRMSMSHIYQPLLIRSLIEAGGIATLRQLAQAFVAQDESQIVFYEQRIKEMPAKVLSGHGVIELDGQVVRLTTKALTFEQRMHVRALCDERLGSFLSKRGLALWNYRLLADPVPDNLRYQVLAASSGRCALCGVSKDERPLDVDHIIPRSRGGKTVLANLQALCSKCNRTKGNKDTRDFRAGPAPEKVAGCPMCAVGDTDKVLETNGTVFAIQADESGAPEHLVVVPHRHACDYFSMTVTEKEHANELLLMLRNRMQQENRAIDGFSVRSDAGEPRDPHPSHAQLHLIARYRLMSSPTETSDEQHRTQIL